MEDVKLEETLEVQEVKEEAKAKIKVNTKFDYRTMKYLNLYILKYKRKTFLLYGILVGLSLGAGIYLTITSEGKDLLWPIIFGLVIIYTIFQALNIEKNLDKHLTNFFNNRPVVSQLIEINSEKITIAVSTKPEEKVDYDWAYVNEICELPQYYYLFISNGGGAPVILDKREEAIEEGSLEELKALIEEKIELKPYKKLDQDIVKRPITFVHPEIIVSNEDEQKEAVEAEVIEEEQKDEE